MTKDIKIPDIGEKVEKGSVVSVLVSKGDAVELDQAIIEFETEKAVVEIPSPEHGKIVEVLVKEGDTLKIGDVIARIDTDAASERPEPEPGAPAPREAEQEEPAPQDETEVSEVRQTSPPPSRKPAPAPTPRAGQTEDTAILMQAPVEILRIPAAASPTVRRLARELGADINAIRGTGPGDRITADDVKEYIKQVVSGGKGVSVGPSTMRQLPDFGNWGKIERETISNVRGVIAENTAFAWNAIPHVTQFDQADITELEKFRAKHGEKVREQGGRLTITPIVMKIIVEALKQFPKFNASIDTLRNEIVYKKYYHIGMAVDTDRGLLMPVVRDADKKSIVELAVEIKQLADQARNKRLSPEDMEGGSFSISNQGGIGGTNFTPIIFWPQVAILGISRNGAQPVLVDGEWQSRQILPLSLSYDHRIIDGADAARFLRWVVEALENPLMLLFERQNSEPGN
ncbi:MAG TPA: 2-oxo acid dehydrogenase subunit E2 [candidate division Zixibacteria bacterium]|nr:2-oxo acid dehydrogenase subunit E2 [candidate division Zixibacteria bacterium]